MVVGQVNGASLGNIKVGKCYAHRYAWEPKSEERPIEVWRTIGFDSNVKRFGGYEVQKNGDRGDSVNGHANGGHVLRLITKKDAKELAKKWDGKPKEAPLQALPNQFPFNEMLFDRRLYIGNHRVKTRSYDPGFTGPVLLYTSGKVATASAVAHGYEPGEYTRPAIVGVGDLKFVRELTGEEKDDLLMQFNNASSVGDVKRQDRWVEPYDNGLFFQRLRRFEEPVEFTAEPGPVKMINVPLSRIAGTLSEHGIEVVDGKLVY